jgi:TatD DNase family protein
VRSPQKQKLVAALPLERLVLETDAPALGPDKSGPNRPANITVARAAGARHKGGKPAEVARVTTANSLRLFPRLAGRLPPPAAAGGSGATAAGGAS